MQVPVVNWLFQAKESAEPWSGPMQTHAGRTDDDDMAKFGAINLGLHALPVWIS